MADDDEDDGGYSRIISVVAGCDRRDRWWLAGTTSVVSLFARSHLDLREVVTDPGVEVVDLTVLCVTGSVTIVVPEGTDVTLSGTSLLASSVCLVAAGATASHLPRIEITATTVLGRIRVVTTPSGSGRARRDPSTVEGSSSVTVEAPSFADLPDPFGIRDASPALADERPASSTVSG
jgi:hypothetical protein